MNIFDRSFMLILTITLMFSLFNINANADVNDKSSNYYANDKTYLSKNKSKDYIIDKIYSLADNNKLADELVKTTYTDKSLKNLSSNIYELFEEMTPECVRISEDKEVAYFVYKSDLGHYAVWICSIKENDVKFIADWYFGKPIYLNEFLKLKEENATLTKVKSFDPYGDYSALYLGSAKLLYTFHYTIDGYAIRFSYKYSKISDVTLYKGKENIFDYYLLPIDSDEIFKKNKDYKVYVDSRKIETVNEIYLDTFSNALMIPLSDINSVFKNVSCDWYSDKETAIIAKDDVKLEFIYGADYIIKNGDKINIKTPADIKNGRMCIPLSELCDALGIKYDLMLNLKTVSLYT